MNSTTTKRREKGKGYVFKRGSTYYLQCDINGRRKVVSLRVKHRADKITPNGEVIKGADALAKEHMEPTAATTKAQIAVHIAESRQLANTRKLPLDEVWDIFTRRRKKRKNSPGTITNYEQHWGRFQAWLQDQYPRIELMKQVDGTIAEAYCEHLEHHDRLSASTYNQHRGTLRLIWKTLKKPSGIDANPWDDTERMESDGISHKELTRDELTTVLSKLNDPAYRITYKQEMCVLFHIGAWTGLRLKDAALLEWSTVDLLNGTITCKPAKTRRHDTLVAIPIHPTLREQLEVARNWAQNNDVLPKIANHYRKQPNTVKRNAVKVFVDAGFETTVQVEGRKKPTNVIGFHSLRHSFVKFCADAGVPLASVQAIVGHTSPAMTLHYAHLDKNTAQRAIDALPSLNAPGMEQLAPQGADPARDRLKRLADEWPEEIVAEILAKYGDAETEQ